VQVESVVGEEVDVLPHQDRPLEVRGDAPVGDDAQEGASSCFLFQASMKAVLFGHRWRRAPTCGQVSASRR
jgi:hypothetical protein